MSIRAKVMGCLALVLVLFAAVSGLNYYRSRGVSERLVLVNELFLPMSRNVAQLQGAVQGHAEDVRRFYFRGSNGSDAGTFSTLVRDLYPYLIQKKLAALERILASPKAAHLGKTADELRTWLAHSKELFTEMAASTEQEKFETTYSKLKGTLQALAKRVDAECLLVTLAAQKEGRENLFVTLFLIGFLLLAGGLILLVIHRALLPLPLLLRSLRNIADGKFNQSLKVQSTATDEVSLLAREYNRMLGALAERDQKIQTQQRELLDSERLAAVGQLSAEVVHEIRNPLNSISLNIDWLQHELEQKMGPDAEMEKTLRSVSREVERLHQITESYLVRARVPVGQQQSTAVNELLREVIEFEMGPNSGQPITLEMDLWPEELHLAANRSRLKQAFLNVFKNAREAMPRGGVLRVKTLVQTNTCRIEVADSGSGMNEAVRQKTFDPFFTTKANGTGLGLSVTREIVEEANGSLSCQSELGKGTTFSFTFPI